MAPQENSREPAKWKKGHTLALVLAIALLFAVGSIPPNEILPGFTPPEYRLVVWLVMLVLLGLCFVVIGYGTTGLWEGLLIDSRNKMSLSRLQLILWTLVVFSAFLAAALFNIRNSQMADPLDIGIPSQVWGLLGISTASFVTAATIKNQKKNMDISVEAKVKTEEAFRKVGDDPSKLADPQGALVAFERPGNASVADLFKGDEVISAAYPDVGKLQMFLLTLILIFVYAAEIGVALYGKQDPIVALPSLSTGIVVLFAISHAGYLTSKYIPYNSVSTLYDRRASRLAAPFLRGQQYLGRSGTILLFSYLAIVLGLSSILVLISWPNAPKNESLLGSLSAQVRYLVLVISGGALGSALHDLSSFMNVIANRSFPKNWLWSYLFRILLAVPLALAFYVLIRGGILTPEAGTNVLNPYGILIASVLVGTFAAPIIDKLLAVEQTLLGQESQLERQIDRIGEALGVTALDNYRGFVCISFQGEGGEGVRFMDSTKPVLRAGRLYELVVWFEPSKPEQGVAEEIRIEGGTNAKEVTFTLAPNSDRFGLRPRQKAVSFGVMEPSPFAQFQFYAPQAPDPHELWVEVSQKNRLVHVASATFYVEGVEQPSND